MLTLWPAEYRQWARENGLDRPVQSHIVDAATRIVTQQHVAAPRRAPHVPLTIVSPPADATYLVDPTLRREFQTLPLRVVANSSGPIEWSVSGQRIGSANADASLDWPLAPGRHLIVARDQQGRMAETTITVR